MAAFPAAPMLGLALGAAGAQAQGVAFLSEDPGTRVDVQVAARIEPATLRPGEFGRIALEVEIGEPWYIYSVRPEPDNGPPTRIELEAGALLRLAGPPGESRPTVELDGATGALYSYHRPRARFWLDVHLPGGSAGSAAPAGVLSISGSLIYAACDGRICLPERRAQFTVRLTLAEGPVRPAYRSPAAPARE